MTALDVRKTERPIIFSGEMIKATLDDLKTNTRRTWGLEYFNASVWKDSSGKWRQNENGLWEFYSFDNKNVMYSGLKCPYGQVGDKLWVKETYFDCNDGDVYYKADNPNQYINLGSTEKIQWKSPFFMPRWASRITLTIENIHVKRLQDMNYPDVVSECPFGKDVRTDEQQTDAEHRSWAKGYFAKYWDSINAKRGYSWSTNCWVWVIEFERNVEIIMKERTV